ncbi:MAG: hypothetical protein IJB79_06815 [Candidatus Gastranaerophilales bacterium]|nr:hypothetical protein [Candidatus Gastranaerophilales bacterium]
MYKFATKVLYGVLAVLFLNNIAFGIGAEFKNSLMKIEIIKISDSTYNLDLYTKNQFLEPVKIIKKSDFNYYVLLPETKNESTRTKTVGTEIREVSANVHPYAGQDVSNGYVKININTTKPIVFNVNVKNNVAAATITKEIEDLALNSSEEKTTEKKSLIQNQKKNSDFSPTKKIESIKKAATQKLPKKQEVIQKIEQPIVKIEDAVREEIEKAREEKLQEVNEELANLEQFEAVQLEETNEEVLPYDDFSEIEQIANDGKSPLEEKITKILSQYGLKYSDFVFVSFLLAILLLVLIIANAKKRKTKAPLKQETITISDENENVENENQKVKNDGQYFVFDKNVKQTGFCDPATSAIQRNYELSSYEPELKNKYNRNTSLKKNNESEYDIIQKILKEDSFIDIQTNTFEQQVKPQTTPNIQPSAKIEAPIQQNKEEIKPKQQEEQKEVEPNVLSSVEIAPQRGFMLVSYNDNIRLLGYIFDDVFALYNFKQPKLENYDIKYRLSEKDDKTARFIVKIVDTKMLVAVNKGSMAVEVML